VQCVWWGKFTEKKPDKGLIEEVPLVTRCSVQRSDTTAAGTFIAHTSIAGDAPFSPGVYPSGPARDAAPPAPPVEAPRPPDAPDKPPKYPRPPLPRPPPHRRRYLQTDRAARSKTGDPS